MSDDVLIRVEGTAKKYCRHLKRSLAYGARDIVGELVGGARPERLRPQEFWAVRDVSFEVRRGECLGLIGANGAGKTTLLKLLNGLIKPDRGRITMRGRVGALIALGAGFNPILTARENIFVNGAILGMPRDEIGARFDEIVGFAEVEEFVDTPVQSFSSGMQVRLGFAIAAVLLRPDVLLLDEVLAVGDARFQTKCINVIKSLQASGVATILVSHNMHDILRYCTTGLYLDRGQVRQCGHIEDVTATYLQESGGAAAGAASESFERGNVPIAPWLELGELHTTDRAGQRLDVVTSEEPVTLRIPYALRRPGRDELRVELAINDASGLFLQTLSPVLHPPSTAAGARGEIRICLPAVTAASGTLVVGVAVWSPDHSELYGWSRENRLKVKSRTRTAGRVVLQPAWELAAEA